MQLEDLKESYYFGAYSKVISDSASLRSSDPEVEFLVLRSRLAQNQVDFVLNATRSQANNVQKALNLLANVLKAGNDDKIRQILADADKSLLQLSEHYAICVGIAYLRIGAYTEALNVLNGIEHDEAIALKIQALIGINRVDLAEEELPNIKDQNLSKVCAAHVGIINGGDSARDVLYAIQDILDRGISTPLLHNLVAGCFFAIGEWENATNAMTVAIEQFPNDESTNINQAVVLSHGTEYEKLHTQLELIKSFNNPYTNELNEMLKDFDQTASRMQSE